MVEIETLPLLVQLTSQVFSGLYGVRVKIREPFPCQDSEGVQILSAKLK